MEIDWTKIRPEVYRYLAGGRGTAYQRGTPVQTQLTGAGADTIADYLVNQAKTTGQFAPLDLVSPEALLSKFGWNDWDTIYKNIANASGPGPWAGRADSSGLVSTFNSAVDTLNKQFKLGSYKELTPPSEQVPLPPKSSASFAESFPIDFLAANKIMDTAAKPVADTVTPMITPLLPMIQQQSEANLAAAKSSAVSDFMKRGLTGSSTELGTIARDLPLEFEKRRQDAVTQLIFQAIPLAQKEKELQTSTALSLRTLISDEQFKALNLSQQREIANADLLMKRELAQLQVEHEARMQSAQLAYSRAKDEREISLAQQQLKILQDQYQDASRKVISRNIGKIVGMVGGGLAGAFLPGGGTVSAVTSGMAAGGTGGDLFAGLFD